MAIEIVNTVEALNFNAVAGEALTKGAAVYLDETMGTLFYANAATGGAGYGGGNAVPCVGFAANAAAIGDTISVIVNGYLDGLSGLSPGDEIFLGETDGTVTNTAPSDSGDTVQVVGHVVPGDTTKMRIELGSCSTVA